MGITQKYHKIRFPLDYAAVTFILTRITYARNGPRKFKTHIHYVQ